WAVPASSPTSPQRSCCPARVVNPPWSGRYDCHGAPVPGALSSAPRCSSLRRWRCSERSTRSTGTSRQGSASWASAWTRLAPPSRAGCAGWLIIPGLLLAGIVGFFKAADVHLRGGWGYRDIAIASTADLKDRYDLS